MAGRAQSRGLEGAQSRDLDPDDGPAREREREREREILMMGRPDGMEGLWAVFRLLTRTGHAPFRRTCAQPAAVAVRGRPAGSGLGRPHHHCRNGIDIIQSQPLRSSFKLMISFTFSSLIFKSSDSE